MKFLPRILLVLVSVAACAKEPVFVIPAPQNFISWLEYKDTNWNGSLNVGNQMIRVKAVSNYTVLSGGFDTSVSVKFSFESNTLGLEQIVIKYRSSAVRSSGFLGKESIENVYLENKTHVYSGSEVSFDSASFKRREKSSSEFELLDLNFKLKTISSSKPIINISLESTTLKVENTFFHIYKKGKFESIDRELYNVDLKGGNEYAPRPLVDFKHDLLAPNDFVLINTPTEALKSSEFYDISRNIQLSKKGKFYKATTGEILVDHFYYKYGYRFKVRSFNFMDSSTMSTLLKIDSMELQFFAMPF
jgi:hypothetical protein